MKFINIFVAGLRAFLTSYKYDESEHKISVGFQAFAKGVLEFIRNLVVVSAIKLFATKADSALLHVTAEIGMIAIAVSVGSYLTRYKFLGFEAIESERWRNALGRIYTALPAFLVYAILAQFIQRVVAEIVKSQIV